MTEQPWHAGKSVEPLRADLVVPMHPSYVPNEGVEWMYRDERSGANWWGVKDGSASVRIVRAA